MGELELELLEELLEAPVELFSNLGRFGANRRSRSSSSSYGSGRGWREGVRPDDEEEEDDDDEAPPLLLMGGGNLKNEEVMG